jgi:hypothetical protein
MTIQSQSNSEVLLVVQLLKICEKALMRSHASISSLLAYVADDLEKEMCEFSNVDRTKILKAQFANAGRPAISRSS